MLHYFLDTAKYYGYGSSVYELTGPVPMGYRTSPRESVSCELYHFFLMVSQMVTLLPGVISFVSLLSVCSV